MIEIKIDKNKEVVAVFKKSEISDVEKNNIIELINNIELFACIDSGKVTDTYVEKNKNIFNTLIELGIKDLYYDCHYIGAGIKTHHFIKNSEICETIIKY